MALRHVCDRCGDDVEVGPLPTLPNGTMALGHQRRPEQLIPDAGSYDISGDSFTIDLCRACIEALRRWFADGRVREAPASAQGDGAGV